MKFRGWQVVVGCWRWPAVVFGGHSPCLGAVVRNLGCFRESKKEMVSFFRYKDEINKKSLHRAQTTRMSHHAPLDVRFGYCGPKCNQRTDAFCSRKCYTSGCQHPKSRMSTESLTVLGTAVLNAESGSWLGGHGGW